MCHVWGNFAVELAVISTQHQLGSAGGGWGSSSEEWWLAAVQNADWLRYKPSHVNHRHTAAELSEGTLGIAALYYAKKV